MANEEKAMTAIAERPTPNAAPRRNSIDCPEEDVGSSTATAFSSTGADRDWGGKEKHGGAALKVPDALAVVLAAIPGPAPLLFLVALIVVS